MKKYIYLVLTFMTFINYGCASGEEEASNARGSGEGRDIVFNVKATHENALGVYQILYPDSYREFEIDGLVCRSYKADKFHEIMRHLEMQIPFRIKE